MQEYLRDTLIKKYWIDKGEFIMKKKLYILIAATVFLTFVLAGCGTDNTSSASDAVEKAEEIKEEIKEESKEVAETQGEEASEDKTDYNGVTIRIATRPVDLAKYDLEEALGFWEEEFGADGIKVEAVKVTNGSDFVDSIASGSVDIGIFGDQPIIAGIANGKALKVIGRNSSDAQGYKVVLRKGSDIKSVEDLKGKVIAFKPGTTNQKIWLQVLAKNGLSIDDVEGVNLEGADALAALKNGDIEALVGYEGNGIDYSNDGEILLDYSEISDSIHLIAASNEFADKYPELVARVLKVYQKTGEWIEANKEEAIAKFEEIGGLDESGATAMYNSETWNVQWDKTDEEVTNGTASWLYDQDVLKDEIKASTFVDTKYLKLAGLTVGEGIDY